MPWLVADNHEAETACEAAGKRLCSEIEWRRACRGPHDTAYSYGNMYDATSCNGIDLFCECDAYPGCYRSCGADFHLVPTGTLPECTNEYEVFDINGNVWEHVQGGDNTRVRGGAYNCGDSEELHDCDYIPKNWTPSAVGFRCCANGWVDGDTEMDGDAGTGIDIDIDIDIDSESEA